MGLVQILAICGAASAALFPSLSHAGEWEEFKALKEAMVRSSAKKDLPLPAWAASLEYYRPAHWQWSEKSVPDKKAPDVPPPPAPVLPVVVSQ